MKQTVLITGTSSGIGKATAKFFHNKGWNVVATMRNPEKEDELNSLENVLVLRLDVTDADSIRRSVNLAIEKFGKMDVVVNNAGYAVAGVFESASKESIERQFAVNVTGLIDVTQAVLPHFRKNRSGVFVNISSMGGKVTFPLLPLYHATKFAVEGFSESLSYELAPFGVKLKIVEPGGVSTDFGTRSLDFQYQPGLAAEYDALVEKMQQFWTNPEHAKGRGTPEEVAEVIHTAATDGTDQLRYVSGKDAEKMLSARASTDDAAYMEMIRKMF